MLIKRKSLLVALSSAFVICLVMVLTLVAYFIYMGLKQESSKSTYQGLLQKVNAKMYSKYIEVATLNAGIEGTGPLRGKPVIEGSIKNVGNRTITELVAKIKFLDRDQAVIYEVMFHPHEPSLGGSILSGVRIPYLSPPKMMMDPGESLVFKKILISCPQEITAYLKKGSNFAASKNRWSGKLSLEIISVGF